MISCLATWWCSKNFHNSPKQTSRWC